MKCIGILGATGSIGGNALKVIGDHTDLFRIGFLSANKNVQKLIEISLAVQPDLAIIADDQLYGELKDGLAGSGIRCAAGAQSLVDAAGGRDCDIILNAIVGAAGLRPTMAAVKVGTDIALSNKESLVVAGELINSLAKEHGSSIFPVDSEHSAIWQCLAGEKVDQVEKLILTGSGGPFLNRPANEFDDIRVEEALKHPNWSMGAKITIDSATMVNKGLELIEAYHLFHLPEDRIDIVIHPQSIVHSMIMFADKSVKAQLGLPDMKIPIQYALTYPDRLPANWENFDITDIGTLTFTKPDVRKFPALLLARDVLRKGGTCPAVFNMANETAVYAFLKKKIKFSDIVPYIEKQLENHVFIENPTENDLVNLIDP